MPPGATARAAPSLIAEKPGARILFCDESARSPCSAGVASLTCSRAIAGTGCAFDPEGFGKPDRTGGVFRLAA